MWGRRDTGTQRHGDAGTWGLGDVGTQGLGNLGMWRRWNSETHGDSMQGQAKEHLTFLLNLQTTIWRSSVKLSNILESSSSDQ